jgi:hypothetical protein
LLKNVYTRAWWEGVAQWSHLPFNPC